jgi:prenyltransferase beta subunit
MVFLHNKNSIVRKMNLWLLGLVLLLSSLGAAPLALAEGASPPNPATVQTVAVQAAVDQPALGQVTIQQAIDGAADNIASRSKDALYDWDAYSLAQAGRTIPSSYLASAAATLQQSSGKLSLATDYARLALAVKAAGGNPENVAGYNLIANIIHSDSLTAQGVNGAIYALQALSSGTYAVPADAKWTADKLIDWLLAHKNADNGWSLAAGYQSNVDITAAVIASLAPYTARADVRQAADAAVSWLSTRQLNNGGFNELGENSESAAQAIIALSALGLDAGLGNFAKANGNLLSYLFTYRQADGGFAHLRGGQTDAAATQQALMALAAYRAFTGKSDQAYEAVLAGATPATEAYVTVHVDGQKGVIVEGSVSASTAYEALTRLLDQAGLPYHATASHYIDSINTDANTALAGSATDYWMYNVKRQGAWDFDQTNQLGLYDYKVRDGDDITVYYSGLDTQLVQSIVPAPLIPAPGQPFSVQVQQTVWDWVYGAQATTVAASVYVSIGDQKVATDTQGIAAFPVGLPAGTYEVTVTGERQDQAPSIAAASRKITVGTADAASIQVEGAQSTYASEQANTGNLLSTLQELLTVRHIPYQITNYSFGKMFTAIGSDKDFWSFAVRRQGQWEIPQVGMSGYTLQPGDTAVVYIGGYDADYSPTTWLVDSIAFNPAQPKAGQTFTVTVKKTLGNGAAVPAQGAKILIGGQTAITDSQGIASFPALSEGSYTVDVTGYVAGQAPTLVHYMTNVAIAPGGTPAIASMPYVSLQVSGGSVKGTIYPLNQVSLQNGDTPYSVLARSLGAGRVAASGSGSRLYVQGIDGLLEFDHGPLSGWVYSVNGQFPSGSAGSYMLANGDKVAWLYTMDGGKDTNGNNGGNVAGSSIGGGSIYSPTNSAAASAADVTAALSQLGLSYTNDKPVGQAVVSTKLIHADHSMDAGRAEQLRKELQANQVDVEQKAVSGAATVIADPNGEASLQIPAQALSGDTVISIKELPAQGRNELISSMYEFAPSGLKFANPVLISLKIPLQQKMVDHPERLALVWLNEQSGQWIPVPAVIDAETGVVAGRTDHFTKYAVIDKTLLLPKAKTDPRIAPAMVRASQWLLQQAELSDWGAYALHQAGAAIPETYAAAVEQGLQQRDGNLRNVTDYERMALGSLAAGLDPRNVGGYDLMERIYNNDRMTRQGSNGPIYALIALQRGGVDVPGDAEWTTQKLLDWLLGVQNVDGSWPLAQGDEGNADLTGAALSALTAYADRDKVRAAMEKAVGWLASVQLDNGGFALEGKDNSESAAQVLWGLSVAGVNPLGERFVKSRRDMVSHLLTFQRDDGGFAHELGGEADSIATEQTLLALASYRSLMDEAGAADGAGAEAYADAAEISPWAIPYVDQAAVFGLMEGVGAADGGAARFEPAREVTRSEFAAILLRLRGVEPGLAVAADQASPFADVAPDAWYSRVVAEAVKLGFVNGVSDTEFAPDRPITREQMALMLARALKLNAPAAGSGAAFADAAEIDASALPAIRAVAAAGLMDGADAGRFLPQEAATREMAAAVAVRAYEYRRGVER